MKSGIKRLIIITCILTAGLPGVISHAQEVTAQESRYVRVVYPNGGESLTVGSTHRIAWNASVSIRTVVIQLVNPERNLIYTIATGVRNTGGYMWRISPTVYPATGYRIKIYDTSSLSTSDMSDRSFSILPGQGVAVPPLVAPQATELPPGVTPGPTPLPGEAPPGWRPETELIKVMYPNTNSILLKDRTYYIRWEAPKDVDYVNLFVSFDDGKSYSRIDVKERARNKRYRWRVPDEVYSSPNCRIKITDYENPYILGTSPRFTIKERGEILGYRTPAPTVPPPARVNITPTPVGGSVKTPVPGVPTPASVGPGVIKKR